MDYAKPRDRIIDDMFIKEGAAESIYTVAKVDVPKLILSYRKNRLHRIGLGSVRVPDRYQYGTSSSDMKHAFIWTVKTFMSFT